MREELTMFVNDNYPPIKQQLFTQAFEIFDDYEVEDYDTPFMEMLDTFDNSDYCSFITSFECLFVNSLLSIIKEHGITLVDDVLLSDVVLIAQGLLDIQDYEDKDAIARTLETDWDNHAKFGELMNLVSTTSAERIAAIIEDMDQNIFLSLGESIFSAQSSSSEATIETDTTKKILENLKAFKNFSNFDEAIGFRAMRIGIRVGSEFEIYGRYLKQFIEDYTDIEKVAKEFFTALLMAKESYLSPLSYYRKISSEYLDDLNLITKVDQELIKIQNEFDKYKGTVIFDQTNSPENAYTGIGTDELPIDSYNCLLTGYEGVITYKDKEYKLINKKYGVRGENIPVIMTKYSGGYFVVDKKKPDGIDYA